MQRGVEEKGWGEAGFPQDWELLLGDPEMGRERAKEDVL